jgi:hypothetical protein
MPLWGSLRSRAWACVCKQGFLKRVSERSWIWGSVWGPGFVEVWGQSCCNVRVCVQIVIELYMLCKIHKEDEIFGLLGSKLSILQKTWKNVKNRQKTRKNAKNRKTPVNPWFFAFFQKRQISFETSIGIFPQKRVFFTFLGGPGFGGPGPVFGVRGRFLGSGAGLGSWATRRFREIKEELMNGIRSL